MNNRSPAPWPLALAVLLAAGGCDSWTAPAADSPTVTPAEYLVIMERELAEVDRKIDELIPLRREARREDMRRFREMLGPVGPKGPLMYPGLSAKTLSITRALDEAEKEWLGLKKHIKVVEEIIETEGR